MSDPPIVDFGAHFYAPLPESIRDGLEAIEGYDGEPVCTDIDAVRNRYATAGVDAAVLSQPFFMGHENAEAVAAANDDLLDLVDAYHEFYGLAAIPVAAGGEAAAAEFERALDNAYNGGALETKTDDIELVDDALEPVFEVADRTGAPLLVHPKLSKSLHPEALSDHWRLNAIFGREIALAESLSKVVHGDILDRYPDLNLVFHHNGGNIAAFLGRIEGGLGRAHRDDAAHLKTYAEFEHLLEDRIYIDTAGYYGDPAAFRRTLDALPASHVLYATDFPFETLAPEKFQEIKAAIESLRGGEDRDAILGGNALDLLVNV